MDKLKHFTAPSHWSYWGLVFSHNDSQFPFPVVCLKSQCNDTESFRRQKSFSPQKLKLLICPWKVTLFSEESSCKYKWIIRSLSVEIGTHCGYKDTAVWQRELFPAHDARRWEVWVPWWVFECHALQGILSLIPSAPLLQVDSQGPQGPGGLSQAADSRHRHCLLGCYHGNPRRKLVVGLLVLLSSSYISPDLHSHSWHSLISRLSLHVKYVALPRISHLKAHYVQSVCF